jgi:hypothetical protein
VTAPPPTTVMSVFLGMSNPCGAPPASQPRSERDDEPEVPAGRPGRTPRGLEPAAARSSTSTQAATIPTTMPDRDP